MDWLAACVALRVVGAVFVGPLDPGSLLITVLPMYKRFGKFLEKVKYFIIFNDLIGYPFDIIFFFGHVKVGSGSSRRIHNKFASWIRIR